MAAPERKRSADAPPCPTAKRVRLTPCDGEVAAQGPLQLDDALRRIFPDAEPRELEACCLAASEGEGLDATVQARDALAARITRAARDGSGAVAVQCSGAVAEHMAAATGEADARSRASWILGVIEAAVAAREATVVHNENAAALREELELAVAAMRRRVAELEAVNFALRVRLHARHRRR